MKFFRQTFSLCDGMFFASWCSTTLHRFFCFILLLIVRFLLKDDDLRTIFLSWRSTRAPPWRCFFYLFVNCFLISWIPTQVSWHVKRFERVIRLHPKWLSHHFSIAQSFQISIYDFTQSFAPFNLHTSSLSFEQQHWSWWWRPSGGSSDHKLVSRSSNFNYHGLNEAQSFTSQLKQMQARKFRTRIKLRSTINHRELKKLALKFVNF